jgi:hypothetical protein
MVGLKHYLKKVCYPYIDMELVKLLYGIDG